MKPIRTVVAAAALALVAAGCGASAETEVEESLRAHHAALLARDFPAACAYNAPEATAKLLSIVRSRGIGAGTCEEAFAEVYSEPGPAESADGVSRSFQVEEVTVDGDEATVSWNATLDGEPRPGTTRLRRTDDRWLLVPEG